jgi:rubrerythrin
MTPVEALKLALAKEEASIKLYKRLAIEHREIEDLLDILRNEEEKHKILIEKKLVELMR